MKNNDAFVWRKKIMEKNMGLNGWCLFCLNLSCISPLLCPLKTKQKKDIVHVVLSSPFVVMSICEMCNKDQK